MTGPLPRPGELPLAGRMALVTGGSGGIASACAARLLRDGCSVTLTARREAELAATADRLRALAADGAEVRWVAGDACTADGVRAAVAAATAPASQEGPDGRLDICVATVGGGTLAPILAMDDDAFAEDLRRNTVSAFLAVKYAAPAIAASGGGSIVAVSTVSARLSWPYLAGYAAGKAGLEALVRVAADELGAAGVRVNAVRPGLVRSQEDSGIFRDEALVADFVAQMPLGRTGLPDDIAEAVRYLAGPESSWTTGQSIAVDGGHELRAAPSFEAYARAALGDAVVDAARAGRVPPARP
ncbi:SDR family NAD(P)-dependent oxidoreductase [Yinghuangia seranimata]|uniref:SDR family NAD(P)-dependent oxidoreductase n=1 Tax=Yinghuangia seranimata TaxID=408067 RepID=UPI00248C5118|nr:SDR family NAD(P)-dependent oxidoreductase [Yinghuangia seranimata]MDI2127974.1 SDR family NAD(P)-dependent oxidoreductase [Yinghuangia seranimata]